MKLTNELFVIPQDEIYILYAPLKRIILAVNKALIKLLQDIQNNIYDGDQDKIIKYLKKKGIIENQSTTCTSIKNHIKDDFTPTSVTLFPTNGCNLNCIYCYASANTTRNDLDLNIAKSAIDFIINNAIKNHQNNVTLKFHGGGEPFLNFELIIKATEYTRKLCNKFNLKLKISATSNGVLDLTKLNWIIKNIDHMNVSFDGSREIQNLQRPLVGGGESFDKVFSSIKFFEHNNQKFSLRSTITNHNVTKMNEIIRLIEEKAFSNLILLQFEPVFVCGRCKTTKTESCDKKTFLENLISAKKEAEKYKLRIHYSGGKYTKVSNHFCGATGKNFFITHNGYITSCLEVTSKNDPNSEIFFYGQFKNEQLKLNNSKLNYLKSRIVENIPNCSKCFAKFSCAGDCSAKVLISSDDIFDTSKNERCYINRGILLDTLKKQFKNFRF